MRLSRSIMAWLILVIAGLATPVLVYRITKKKVTNLDPLGKKNWRETIEHPFSMENDHEGIRVEWVNSIDHAPHICMSNNGLWRSVMVSYEGKKLLSSSRKHRPGANAEVNFGLRLWDLTTKKPLFEGARFYLKKAMVNTEQFKSDPQQLAYYIDCSLFPPGDYLITIEAIQETIAWQSSFADPANYITESLHILNPEQAQPQLGSAYEELSDRVGAFATRTGLPRDAMLKALAQASLEVAYSWGNIMLGNRSFEGSPLCGKIDIAEQAAILLARQTLLPEERYQEKKFWYLPMMTMMDYISHVALRIDTQNSEAILRQGLPHNGADMLELWYALAIINNFNNNMGISERSEFHLDNALNALARAVDDFWNDDFHCFTDSGYPMQDLDHEAICPNYLNFAAINALRDLFVFPGKVVRTVPGQLIEHVIKVSKIFEAAEAYLPHYKPYGVVDKPPSYAIFVQRMAPQYDRFFFGPIKPPPSSGWYDCMDQPLSYKNTWQNCSPAQLAEKFLKSHSEPSECRKTTLDAAHIILRFDQLTRR